MLAQLLDFATPSLREIAAQAGLSYAAVQNYAKGRRTPALPVLQRLATVLHRRGGELQKLAVAVGQLGGTRQRRHPRTPRLTTPHRRTT